MDTTPDAEVAEVITPIANVPPPHSLLVMANCCYMVVFLVLILAIAMLVGTIRPDAAIDTNPWKFAVTVSLMLLCGALYYKFVTVYRDDRENCQTRQAVMRVNQ
jgi:hypothetical protein